jgi:pimeloyl-ACP methyl ester carboxylesterase
MHRFGTVDPAHPCSTRREHRARPQEGTRITSYRLLRTPFLLHASLLILVLLVAACDGDDAPEATPTATPTAAATPSSPPSGAGADPLQWGDCPFAIPSGVEVECGTLTVLANRDDPNGDTIRLPFAVFSALDGEPTPDPVVYLSGGPGGAALELVEPGFGALYEPLMHDRDLIVFDQRGTGLSEPSLHCFEYDEFTREALTSGLDRAVLVAGLEQSLDACRGRLAGEGINFAHYNSHASAADLDELRQALGYQQWNIYGLSYGSRLALTSMRHYPDGIRSVVLDSAYPLEANLYTEAPANAARAFDAFFAACAADAACAGAYPNLEPTFYDTVAALNEEPASITMLDAFTGQPAPATLTGDDLVGFLFQSLYDTNLAALLPELITAGGQGDFDTVGLLLSVTLLQLEFVSTGMMLSVQCQEEIPFGDRASALAAAQQRPELQGFFEIAVTVGVRTFDVCERWDAGAPPPGSNEAVASDIPALVLSGELDPITPPRWGEQVAASLSSSQHFQFPHTGHGVLPYRECAQSITRAFFADPASAPDSTCIDDVPPPPFTTEGAQVTMEPFTNTQLGYEGLRPAEWLEAVPGIYQESLLVTLTQLVIPGIPPDLLLAQVAMLLGLDGPPEPVDTIETEAATWQIYEYRVFGQAQVLALAEANGRLALIELSATPARQPFYRDRVLIPAVEGFRFLD